MPVDSPKFLIAVGASMLIAGWLIAFLTVIRLIEENFYLLMAAYAINLAGLFLGMYGVSSYIYIERQKRRKRKLFEDEVEQEV